MRGVHDIVIAVLGVWRLALSYADAAPQVTLGNTVVTGADWEGGLEFFGGLPYALPPIGERRFTPPVLAPTLNSTTFDATDYGPGCMQTARVADRIPFSEDCLRLNVVRPAKRTAGQLLPVMIWFHGGAFENGYTSIYDPRILVSTSISRGTPILYVNVGYRLGPFGFPTGTEAGSKGYLNLGLKDMITALQWTQMNIGAFGGDKSKVTIFGESAGAMAIAMLYLNSDLEVLARAAILQSGTAGSSRPALSSSGDDLWKTFVSNVSSCRNATSNNTFSCLRSATAEEILAAAVEARGPGFPFTPVIDGPGGIIPDLPSRLLSSGTFSKLPFIAGTNLDEGTLFAPATVNSTQALHIYLRALTLGLANDPQAQDEFIDRLIGVYPDDPASGSPFGTGDDIPPGKSAEWKRAAAIAGDVVFQAGRREFSNAAAANGVKNYGYLFTAPQARALGPGVAHASEIPYVYGLRNMIFTQPGLGYERVSAVMMDYWISFATSLDPNDGKGTSRRAWPQYTRSSQVIIELKAEGVAPIPDTYRAKQISFINANASVFSH